MGLTNNLNRWRPLLSVAVLSPGSDLKLDEPLEWVGDLMDLQSSDERIPRYVRSLRHDGESLLETAQRLAIQPN